MDRGATQLAMGLPRYGAVYRETIILPLHRDKYVAMKEIARALTTRQCLSIRRSTQTQTHYLADKKEATGSNTAPIGE